MYKTICQTLYLLISNNVRERGWHSVKVMSWIWIANQMEALGFIFSCVGARFIFVFEKQKHEFLFITSNKNVSLYWVLILNQLRSRRLDVNEGTKHIQQKHYKPWNRKTECSQCFANQVYSVMVKYAVQLVLSGLPGSLCLLVSLKPKWGLPALRSGVCIPLNVSYYGCQHLSAGKKRGKKYLKWMPVELWLQRV